jgi:hypothetical protein
MARTKDPNKTKRPPLNAQGCPVTEIKDAMTSCLPHTIWASASGLPLGCAIGAETVEWNQDDQKVMLLTPGAF